MAKMEVQSWIDEPGRFDSLATWERHLEKVKRLPKDAIEREPLIRAAEEVIAEHKQRAALRKKPAA